MPTPETIEMLDNLRDYLNKLKIKLIIIKNKTDQLNAQDLKLQEEINTLRARIASCEIKISAVSSALNSHINNKSNPHQVNKDQIGLGNVDNFATATPDETKAGTANNLYITPFGLKAALDNSVSSVLPPGAVSAFAVQSAPSGWLICNGQAVPRLTYPNLFAAIGTSFGSGDGTTTFNVPDLRGEFIRGWDSGRGVDSGRGFGTWQSDDYKSHSHGLPIGRDGSLSMFSLDKDTPGNDSYSKTERSAPSGGNETRPRNIALLYCIKH